MTELFEQYATDAERKYRKAFIDLSNAIDSYNELTPEQKMRLIQEMSIAKWLIGLGL